MAWWEIIVYIVIPIYIGAIVFLYFFQEVFLFHPEKLARDFKFKYDTDFEEVFINVKNGAVINGLLFFSENPKGVVFYFKGNTRSIKGWAKFARDFLPFGYDFFIVDYPGFGKSVGKRTEKDIYMDVDASYEWLSQRYPEEKIVIYGRSLGAAFATEVAARFHPRMLILDSPYPSFFRLANYYAWMVPLWIIIRYKMPVEEFLQNVECPVFIIHGIRDKMIPYRFSPELKKKFPEKVTLFTIKEGRHNNLPRLDQYHKVLGEILSSGQQKDTTQ